MGLLTRKGPKQKPADLRVDDAQCPGWVSGLERLPAPGERVYTCEGAAVVLKLLGKTATGGRLLELTMDDGRKAPFFAAADNILVAPTGSPAATAGTVGGRDTARR